MSQRSVESAQGSLDPQLVNEALRLWKLMGIYDEMGGQYNMSGAVVKEIRIRGPELTGGGYQAVIKVRQENGPDLVCFRSAETNKELHLKILSDIQNDRLTFKEDKPWKPAESPSAGG